MENEIYKKVDNNGSTWATFWAGSDENIFESTTAQCWPKNSLFLSKIGNFAEFGLFNMGNVINKKESG